MLKKFSVSNFKCFNKRITFDLSDPANYSFNQQVIQDGIKAKGIIYGANGSGKSNFALAIFDIVLHLTDKEKLLKKYSPYRCLNSKSSITEFQYDFVFDNIEVVYRYGKTDPQTLVYESLYIAGVEVLSYRFDAQTGHVDLPGAESLSLSTDLPTESDRLSRVKYVKSNAILRDEPSARAFRAFTSFVDNMLMFYSLDERGYQGLWLGYLYPGHYSRRKDGGLPRILAPAGNLPEPRIRGREWSSRALLQVRGRYRSVCVGRLDRHHVTCSVLLLVYQDEQGFLGLYR